MVGAGAGAAITPGAGTVLSRRGGVLRSAQPPQPQVNALFEEALAVLKAQGAVLVGEPLHWHGRRTEFMDGLRDALLKPAGAGDIVIGGDKLADRKPGEVVYYGSGAYSSVKPQRFDSHGGWIARPIDLLRLRPDLRAAERGLSVAAADLGVARADRN